MTDEEIKQEILNLLKREKEKPLGEIAFMLKTNYYKIKYILSELKDEGKVINEKRGRWCYWRLKR